MDVWNEFEKQVAGALNSFFGVEAELNRPPAGVEGDLSTSICFALAKKRKASPVKLASSFTLAKGAYPLIAEARAVGPYINFFLDWEAAAAPLLNAIIKAGDNYGKTTSLSGHVLVEFPAVNPNKPWHVGHARNAVLGDTLSRILTSVGYKVTKIDYINDLGLQVAKVYWGTKYLKEKLSNEKFDHALGKLYVEVEKAVGESNAVLSEVRRINQLMEQGSNETSLKVRELVDKCVFDQYETAFKLNVFHDLLVFESNISKVGLLKKSLEKIKTHSSIHEGSEDKTGCLVADLSSVEDFKNLKDSEVVLLRSDGTATYTAKDIAFQLWKFGIVPDELSYSPFIEQPNKVTALASSSSGGKGSFRKADMVFNVVGMEQAHEQRLVYETLNALGYKKEFENSYHLSYEHVRLPKGEKLSGRKGSWIGFSADEIIDEAESRAMVAVESKNPTLPEEEQQTIAASIGRGAVRYALLKSSPEKMITFKWEEVLSFDGNAAPYLQYAYARCSRILEEKQPEQLKEKLKLEKDEIALLRHIALWPSLLRQVASSIKKEKWGTRLDIQKIGEYAYELANLFSKFYTNCRVLGSPEEPRRLSMVAASRQTLKNVLNILGIDAPERM